MRELKRYEKHLAEEAICIICGSPFYRNRRALSRGGRSITFRKFGCKTCSKECTRQNLINITRLSAARARARKRNHKLNGERVSSLPHEQKSSRSTRSSAIHTSKPNSKMGGKEGQGTKPRELIANRLETVKTIVDKTPASNIKIYTSSSRLKKDLESEKIKDGQTIWLDERANYRADGRVEWVCEHGVGHTIKVPKGKEKSDAWWSHGCDGCCRRLAK